MISRAIQKVQLREEKVFFLLLNWFYFGDHKTLDVGEVQRFQKYLGESRLCLSLAVKFSLVREPFTGKLVCTWILYFHQCIKVTLHYLKTLLFFPSIVMLWEEVSLERILLTKQREVVTEHKMGYATWAASNTLFADVRTATWKLSGVSARIIWKFTTSCISEFAYIGLQWYLVVGWHTLSHGKPPSRFWT